MEASETAKQGFESMGVELYSLGLAGPFARWLAHLGKAESPYAAARGAIEVLLGSLSSLDALDQVEVMCAGRTLGIFTGTPQGLEEQAIQERLYHLPAEVVNHLSRLGSLP